MNLKIIATVCMSILIPISTAISMLLTANPFVSAVYAAENKEKAREEVYRNTIVLNKNDDKTEKYEANKLLFMTTTEDDGKLLFSDSPETVEHDGILFQDTVKGDARLLYYHLNGMKENKKVAVVVENMAAKPNKISITRKATGGPSDDYLYVGKTTLTRYFGEQQPESFTIEPNGKRLLYEPDGQRIVPSGGLVYGIFDFNADKDLKVTVVIAPENANLINYVKTAPILPKDVHRLRGTYNGKDRYLTNRNPYTPSRMGKAYFYIGDNKTDLYKYGFDSTDDTATQNFGNYGVIYTFHPRLNGDGQTSYYLKPIGGVYAGAMSVRIGKDGERKMIKTPDEMPFFGHEAEFNYYSYLGTYNNKDDVYFEYTPPGASNLPVEIILIPEK